MENTYSINPVLEAMSSSTTLSRDLPPVTYLANKIASQLLQSGEGAYMFDRRCDADCVLNVGQRRYYVHVQMLAVSTLRNVSCVFALFFSMVIVD